MIVYHILILMSKGFILGFSLSMNFFLSFINCFSLGMFSFYVLLYDKSIYNNQLLIFLQFGYLVFAFLCVIILDFFI
jgi:hypothetical protein